MPNRQDLLEKIQSLPLERIAEVEDFIDFLAARERARSFIRAASALSGPAFGAIWNNAEDDAYDAV